VREWAGGEGDYSEEDQEHADADGEDDYCRSPVIKGMLGAIPAAGWTAFVVALSGDQAIACPTYTDES
jgi:hypothetical protein